MKATVFTSKTNSHFKRIESAVALINGCQNHFHLDILVDESFAGSGDKVNPLSSCSMIENKCPQKYCILVTEDLLDDNWFSHEYRSSAIITIGDWERLYAPPSLKSYLIYQIAQALIHFASDMSEEMALNIVHEPPVGCIYDMAVHKSDIKLGMVAGNLCTRCASQLKALGTSQQAIDAVIRIVELVRSEALGKPVALDPKQVFVVMRFSKNDENDNAWRYGIMPGIEKCGLNPMRADSQVESRQILEKVYNHIRRSRLIVAKVDVENLNVYFELGVSMGLEKDVLLISESTMLINLPSDLKNWECLTYEKGNYDQLSRRIQDFLVLTYGVSA